VNEKFEHKWNEDTSKVIKVFNESEEHFLAAWKKLDAYYNTTEAVDTSSLMTYLTTT
jgi:hypothetical protein